MMKTGKIKSVFRPCCCAVVCQKIRNKLRCFVQITVAAPPMRKLDRFGNRRHILGRGRVGNDVGTQSVAVVANNAVELVNLGERSPGLNQRNRQRINFLLQKIDRSRRVTNPNRFDKDGRYIRGSHEMWVISNRYRKLIAELKEIYRKDAASRLYANRELANYVRSLGDELIVEPSNARALARRSKKLVERQDKTTVITQKDGTQKTIRKFRRKKRFGASIGKRSPAGYQMELRIKFGSGYHEVPGMTYRASQYDPFLDQYIKKKLSDRWHILPDGRKIQRDIMSAFLLYCADSNFVSIDRNLCLNQFDNFWKMHQKCINLIIQKNLRICNSGIYAV